MRIIRYVLLLIIILLGVTFAILNPEVVKFNYYLGEKSLHLSLLMVMTFICGMLLGLLISFWFSIKIKIQNYKLRQQLKVTEKEIQNLRVLPFQDKH